MLPIVNLNSFQEMFTFCQIVMQKYQFIRGLIDWEIYQRSHHYLKSASEWTSKAIVSLDLTEDIIKSIKQASQLDGVGKEISKKLRDFQAGILISNDPPPLGKFMSSAPAILVTLLITKQQMIANNNVSPDKCYIPEEVIKDMAPTLCQEQFRHIQAEGEVFCPALWRINVMCTRGYIKKRSVAKESAYELLPAGEIIAQRLKDRQFQTTPIPSITLPYLTGQHNRIGRKDSANSGSTVINPMEDALYTNDDGTDGLTLLVDTQEWGGDRVGLGELIRMIERYRIRYKTKKLKCGDYSWIWRCGEDEIVLPLLIERKRADDLARSLRDGRYINQKKKMVEWRECFSLSGVVSSLKYLIEGRPEQYAVRCLDMCGAVLKCGYPTVQQLKMKIEEIDNDHNFELVQTEDIQATVQYLNSIHTDLQNRLNNGDFDELLVKRIDNIRSKKDYKDDNIRSRKNCQDKNANLDQRVITNSTQPAGHGRSTQEELNQTESQEMLDVELGQYHCAGDCGNQVNPKNTPENQTRLKDIKAGEHGRVMTNTENLPYVRAQRFENISSPSKSLEPINIYTAYSKEQNFASEVSKIGNHATQSSMKPSGTNVSLHGSYLEHDVHSQRQYPNFKAKLHSVETSCTNKAEKSNRFDFKGKAFYIDDSDINKASTSKIVHNAAGETDHYNATKKTKPARSQFLNDLFDNSEIDKDDSNNFDVLNSFSGSTEVVILDSSDSAGECFTVAAESNVSKLFLNKAKQKSGRLLTSKEGNGKIGKENQSDYTHKDSKGIDLHKKRTSSLCFLNNDENSSSDDNDLIIESDNSEHENDLVNTSKQTSKYVPNFHSQKTGHLITNVRNSVSPKKCSKINLTSQNSQSNFGSPGKIPKLNLTPNCKLACVLSKQSTTPTVSAGKIYTMKRKTNKNAVKIRNRETAGMAIESSYLDIDDSCRNKNLSQEFDSELPDLDSIDNVYSGTPKKIVKTSASTDYSNSLQSSSHIRLFQEEIKQIKDILPGADNDKVMSLLETYSGNVDLVVSALLDQDSQNIY